MVYSLFYCSLLLALFPLFCSSTTLSTPPSHAPQALSIVALLHATTCSSLRCHTLHVTLSCSAGSFNPRSSSRHHTLLATLSRTTGSSKSRSSSHHRTLLLTLSRFAGSFKSCSLPHHRTLLVTLSCPTGSFNTCFALRCHTLLATLPRSKIPLNTPCFVTRKTMAEGAKKHDDFRLPT